MRRPILPIAFALALLTGVWIGQAYALFTPAGSIAASDANIDTNTAAEAAVWRFYDAIDLLLRTGDDSDLRDAVAPDFVDHTDRPGLPPSRDGLLRYLASLRQSHPALRLAPRELLVQGNRVVAQVELAGNSDGSFLGMPLAGPPPWASVDIFRLAGGRIAEHWSEARGLIVTEPLLSASLVVPPGLDLIPSLERLTVAPGAGDHARNQTGPAVLLAESGAVDVTVDGALTVLAPGDGLVIPAGAAFATRNQTDTTAVVLVLGLDPPIWPSGPGEPEAGPAPLPPGITTRRLANGTTAATKPGPHTVSVGRVTLGSGSQLAAHQTVGTESLVVVAGTLTATFTGNPARAWLQNSDLGSTAAGDVEHVAANTGLSVSPNAVATYRNDGPTPLSLLIVTIEPAVGDSP